MQYNPEAGQNPAQQNPSAFSRGEEQRTYTTTPDPHYDLVSVLYHALEGAQTCACYAEDAKRTGDQELTQFFLQAQQNQNTCADRAKQLLGRYLSQSTLH